MVYLSLGSNLGNRAANLHRALMGLEEFAVVYATSSLYETEPVEVEGDQPWFLNCAVAAKTSLMPAEFLSRILTLEGVLGRQRSGKKSPRTLDIDIIFFGKAVLKTPALTIPHPAMQHRRFVLQPLAEIAPAVRHPILKRTVQELLDALPQSGGSVRRFRQD